jgi:hypothetical protein
VQLVEVVVGLDRRLMSPDDGARTAALVERVEGAVLVPPRHRAEPPPLGLLGRDVGLVDGAKVVSRASGMRSIRGPEVPRGSLRVSTRHVQSPTPYTLALGSYLPTLSAVQLIQV